MSAPEFTEPEKDAIIRFLNAVSARCSRVMDANKDMILGVAYYMSIEAEHSILTGQQEREDR